MSTDNQLLIEWLRVQLDAEERSARQAVGGPYAWLRQPHDRGDWGDGFLTIIYHGDEHHHLGGVHGEHIATWDPARVLAEVKAKRAILDTCTTALTWKYSPAQKIAFAVLHDLAQPYAGRDGWHDEWSVPE